MSNPNDYAGEPLYGKHICELMRRISDLFPARRADQMDPSPSRGSYSDNGSELRYGHGSVSYDPGADPAPTFTFYFGVKDSDDDAAKYLYTWTHTVGYAGEEIDIESLKFMINCSDGTTETFSITDFSSTATFQTSDIQHSGTWTCLTVAYYSATNPAPWPNWLRYDDGEATSIGAQPDDDALDGSFVAYDTLRRLRSYINQELVGCRYGGSYGLEEWLGKVKFFNPSTGNPYNWTASSADNLYYVAMGDRTKYGATGGALYTWTRMSSNNPTRDGIYDIDIGEIYECVRTLEEADTLL